jgi:hypothetical protein
MSFAGTLPSEHWFLSLTDARSKIEAWWHFYITRSDLILRWHRKHLTNSSENKGPKRIHGRQRKSESVPIDGPGIGEGGQVTPDSKPFSYSKRGTSEIGNE